MAVLDTLLLPNCAFHITPHIFSCRPPHASVLGCAGWRVRPALRPVRHLRFEALALLAHALVARGAFARQVQLEAVHLNWRLSEVNDGVGVDAIEAAGRIFVFPDSLCRLLDINSTKNGNRLRGSGLSWPLRSLESNRQ